MIEWWQAVLISLASALATGGVALLVQNRQQRHDARMQAQRLQAERESRREQALRNHLKEQAKPLYDFLGILERDQGRRFFGNVMRSKEAQDRGWDMVKDHIDRSTYEAVWNQLVAADAGPDVRWQDLIKDYAGRFFVMGDQKLSDMLFKLLMHMAAGQREAGLPPSEISTLIRDARARIATAIVDLEPLEDNQRPATRD